MHSVICVDNVVKKFKEQVVLDHVSLSCNSGEIVGIIGRNGSGKTVLFKCICGFLKANEGKISINEKEIHKDIDMLTCAGIIIEEPTFLRNCSGIKNLEYIYRINHKKNKKHLQKIMQKMGLDAKSRKHVKNYSLGMKQRLGLAQALMENPEILILDEPMNGLDNQGVTEVRDILLAYKNEGNTILIASHNKEDIELLCDKVYEMDHGKLVSIR